MSEAKGYMGFASDSSWGLVVSGGHPSVDTVEVTKDGSNFEQLQPLPETKYAHCLVIVDESTLFVSGGYKYKKTFLPNFLIMYKLI